jgi:hypothetical protein
MCSGMWLRIEVGGGLSHTRYELSGSIKAGSILTREGVCPMDYLINPLV